MGAKQLRAAINSIHNRWEHGHDGLTVDCALCVAERAELAALIAVSAATRPSHVYASGRPAAAYLPRPLSGARKPAPDPDPS